MTDQNHAAQAAEQDPLSDEYVNAVIRQHGYGHPTAVAARLWQWIGLHGGENSVTLLIYEAHKALSKVRAEGVQAGGERDAFEDFEAQYLTDGNGYAPVSTYKACGEAFKKAWPDREAAFAAAKAEYDRLHRPAQGARAALASAPVAGEAVAWRVTHPRSPKPGWEDAAREQPPTLENVKQQDPDLVLELSYAAPQASEAVRNPSLIDLLIRAQAWMATTRGENRPNNLIRLIDEALKTQADKDGGDCAKGEGDEPIAWESTTSAYIKFITDSRYQKFAPAVRKWYRPYRCSTCAALSPTQPTEQGERDE